MIVVFDTNVFHADVRADRSLLRSILDEAAAKGMFKLYVPTVVLEELEKQFEKRSKKVARDINSALGEFSGELRELGLPVPTRMTYDAEDIAGYRAALERRLASVGAEILPIPSDLKPAINWAVHRRKPFKESGEGFPDAVIWLSLLDLVAKEEDEIVFVSSNASDFADSKTKPELARVLKDDVAARGRPRDHVRLVTGIHAFAEEVSQRRLAAVEQARHLADLNAFARPIEDAIGYMRIDQRSLRLGLPLDSDPQVIGWDIGGLEIKDAAELPGGTLLVDATVEVEALLSLLVYKADYWSEAENPPVTLSIVDGDFNDHYLEAETTTILTLTLQFSADPGGENVEVEIRGVELAPVEEIIRALGGRGHADLLDVLESEVGGMRVENFEADARIESTPDAKVSDLEREGSFVVDELIESDGFRHVVALSGEVAGSVEWVVTDPTPFDAEAFASLRFNADSDAPGLQELEWAVPLTVAFSAAWDPEHGWHHLHVDQVAMVEEERRVRASRPTKSEELYGEHHEADED